MSMTCITVKADGDVKGWRLATMAMFTNCAELAAGIHDEGTVADRAELSQEAGSESKLVPKVGFEPTRGFHPNGF